MARVDEFHPMLLDERPLVLDEPGWLYELKMDGYRMLAEFDGAAQLRTRNGADATTWFPEITQSLAKLKNGLCVVDGEVCVLDEIGRSDFNQLQDRARRRGRYPGAATVVYCIFDLLVHRGVDIRTSRSSRCSSARPRSRRSSSIHNPLSCTWATSRVAPASCSSTP